jgi:MtfA peptidase
MLKSSRRKKLRDLPLTTRQRGLMEEYCLFLSRLPNADRRELEGHAQVFLAEKNFEGCGGLVVREEHRLCIAAQACTLLLHRNTDYFPGLKSILIYPSLYVAPATRHIGSGVMEERTEMRAGESWQAGALVLAWDEVCKGLAAPDSGYNVVLHEFAHQLDYEDGHADGVPLLGHGETLAVRRRRYADWVRVMRTEYEGLRSQIQRGESTFLRPYAATNPAEFFAVATEFFFGRPRELRERHPALYGQMKWYYQQDPAEWSESSF